MDNIPSVSSIEPMQGPTNVTETLKVPYGAALGSDINSFNASMDSARGRLGADQGGMNDIAKAAFEPLDHINKEAQSLGDYAKSALESGNSLTPSEIVNLTVQSQKFMFHSQLVANIANRSADGLQQLFRQQG